jgi:predicted PurR-regulated permease PerM
MSDRLSDLLAHPVALATATFASGLLVAGLFLWVAAPILFTLGLSAMLYMALSPSVDDLVRRNVNKPAAVALVMVIVIVFMLALVALLYPVVAQQFEEFSSRAGTLDEHILHLCTELNGWLLAHHIGDGFDAEATARSLLAHLTHRADVMSDAVASWFNEIAFSLLLVPLITFFLLKDYRSLRNEGMQLLPNRYFEMGWLVYNAATSQLQSYGRGIFVQALSMSLISTAGFWLLGLDYAPVLGLLVGLLNLIPFFGITLAKIPPVLVVLLSDQPDVWLAVFALGVVFVAQAVDSFYLLPRVVARSASLHPLTVMTGVMLGGYYFGFFGLILAVPVIFSVKVIYAELVRGFCQFHIGTRHS